jgi:hypothetical protein
MSVTSSRLPNIFPLKGALPCVGVVRRVFFEAVDNDAHSCQ